MLHFVGDLEALLYAVLCGVLVCVTLQRRDPKWLRSGSPQSWPTGSYAMLKTSRSDRRTAAGLQRWSTISERTCWNSWGAVISLSSRQLTSSPAAATLRKLRWGHDDHSQSQKATVRPKICILWLFRSDFAERQRIYYRDLNIKWPLY